MLTRIVDSCRRACTDEHAADLDRPHREPLAHQTELQARLAVDDLRFHDGI